MKEKLTLKNKKNIFKTLEITEKGVMCIGITQSNFENFWSQLEKIECSPEEKNECLRKLKEACSWYSRGIAKYNQK